MEYITPAGIPPLKNPLTPGVRAGDFVFVSGQVPSRDGGFVVGDFEAEVLQVLDNVERILQAAGGSLADLCKVNAYLSSGQLFAPFNDAYRSRLGQTPPARTTLVAGFGHPDIRVEIDAIAYLPERDEGRAPSA